MATATLTPAESVLSKIQIATEATAKAVSTVVDNKSEERKTGLIKQMVKALDNAEQAVITTAVNTEPGRTAAEKEDLKNVREVARSTEA